MILGYRLEVRNHIINLAEKNLFLKDNADVMIVHESRKPGKMLRRFDWRKFRWKYEVLIGYWRRIHDEETRQRCDMKDPRDWVHVTLKNGYAWVFLEWDDIDKDKLPRA